MESLDKNFNSTHWEKMIRIDEEIDIVNEQIKSNFKTIKELEHLRNQQLKELKILYNNKKDKMTKEDYLEQRSVIKQESENATNKILEDLAYNTSFIVYKYDELTKLKEHNRIKGINSTQKAELKEINKLIKSEKKLVSDQLEKTYQTYKENGVDHNELPTLKDAKAEKYGIIEATYESKVKEIEDSLIKSKKSTKYTVIATIVAIAVPLLLLTGLLLNYLVFLPNSLSGAFSFSNPKTIPAFVVCMIMVLTTLGMVTFIIRKSAKRMVVDRKQNTTKLVSIGLFASFFELLGIGSFTTSLVVLKNTKTFDDDKYIPGTLNMAFTVPLLMEASLLVAAVEVEIVTLIVCVVAAVIGSYIGAMLINKINTKYVKLAISIACFLSAIFLILVVPQVPLIKAATGVGLIGTPWKLVVAGIAFVFIGALMSLGLGPFAFGIPLLAVLGVSMPTTIAIVISASAFLMPIAAYKFYKSNNYLPKTSLTLMLGGIFGVILSFAVYYCGIQAGLGFNPKGDTLGAIVFNSFIKYTTIVFVLYSGITMMMQYIGLEKRDKELAKTKVESDRKKLHLVGSKKELLNEINTQMLIAAKHLHKNKFDAKTIVQREKIPMSHWAKSKHAHKH